MPMAHSYSKPEMTGPRSEHYEMQEINAKQLQLLKAFKNLTTSVNTNLYYHKPFLCAYSKSMFFAVMEAISLVTKIKLSQIEFLFGMLDSSYKNNVINNIEHSIAFKTVAKDQNLSIMGRQKFAITG